MMRQDRWWILPLVLSLLTACGAPPEPTVVDGASPQETPAVADNAPPDAPAPGADEPAPELPAAPPDLLSITGGTFGDDPACSLLSAEQVTAAFGEAVEEVKYSAGIGCSYLDQYGFGLLTVNFDSGAGLECGSADGTYLGYPVEPIAGLGEAAIWVEPLQTLCVLQSGHRFQIDPVSESMVYEGMRELAVELARAAKERLP